MNWWIFLGVLLAPPVITYLSASVRHEQANESVSPVIGFFGGAAGGIVAGTMAGLRVGKTVGTRVGLGIVFSLLLAVVCVMLSFGGCMVGGYQLHFE